MGKPLSNLASKQTITVWMFNERKRVEDCQLLWCTPNFQEKNRRISFQNRELFPREWRRTFLLQLGVKLLSTGETNFEFVKKNFGGSSQDCGKTRNRKQRKSMVRKKGTLTSLRERENDEMVMLTLKEGGKQIC